jgi:hypothetical protein
LTRTTFTRLQSYWWLLMSFTVSLS